VWSKASFARWVATLRTGGGTRGAWVGLRVEWLEGRALPASGIAAGAGQVGVAARLDFFGADGAKSGPFARAGYDLAYLFEEFQAYTAGGGTAANFQPANTLLRVAHGTVAVEVLPTASLAALQSDLAAAGFATTGTSTFAVSGLLPITSLASVASLASLRAVAPAYRAVANVGTVQSQGAAGVGSDGVNRFLGLDGTGVTVGVISDSYNVLGGAGTDVAGGNLPGGANAVTVLSDGTAGDTDEGRAMLQIVHDVAPGAALAFATAGTSQAQLAAAIRALANAGAHVVVDDVTFPTEPMFQDGLVAQAVDQVVAAGVSYFSAAGNYGAAGYQAAFRNSGVNLGTGGTGKVATSAAFVAHDFDPGPGVDYYQTVTLPAGKTTFSFQWADPFFSVSGGTGARTDLDLAVFDASGAFLGTLGGFSRNVGGDAVEVFTIDAGPTGGTYQFAIGKAAGPDPALLKYVALRAGFAAAEYATNSGTVFGHANAAGAEAVGAVAYTQTPAFGTTAPVVEPFSARGGTPILFDTSGNAIAAVTRQSPDLVAPDGVSTTVAGFTTFTGTSAAAPHAAGVAALLLQANSTLTPAQVYSTLETTALDVGPAGYDSAAGWGLVRAPQAAFAVGGPFAVTFDGTAGNDALLVRRGAAGDIEFVRGGAVQFSVPYAEAASVVVNGLGGADTLTIDYADGDPVPAGGLSYNGGMTAGGDRFVVTGYAAASATVTHTGPAGGNLRVGSSALVTFAQVGGVALGGAAADLVVNLPGTTNPGAVIADDGDAADPDGAQTLGASSVRGPTFGYTQFTNPTGSLTVNLGGGGTAVGVRAMDAGFAPGGGVPFRVVGGAAADAVTVARGAGNVDATPTSAADVVIAGAGGPALTVSTAGTVTVTTAGRLTVHGTAGADAITFAAGRVAVNGLKPVGVGSGVAALALLGHQGADTIDVTPGAMPVTVDGGGPAGPAAGDTLVVRGAAGVADAFNVFGAADGNSGAVAVNAAAVAFSNVGTVRLDGGGGAAGDTLTVAGSGAADIFTLTGTANQSGGRLEVNAAVAVVFQNFGPGAAVALSGGGGDDTFTVVQAASWGVGRVDLDGGPAASGDTAVVVGTPGDDYFAYYPGSDSLFVSAGAGTTYTFAGIENRRIDGGSQSGADTLATPYFPGPVPPAGAGTLPTGPPLAYRNIERFQIGDAPYGRADAATTPENVPVAIDVLANDYSLGDGPFVLSVAVAPLHGSAAVVGGKIVYLPDYYYNDAIAGPDRFAYAVTDANGETATTTVTVNVTPVNDAPAANIQSLTVAAGVSTAVALTGDDGDPGVTQALTFTITAAPTHGTLSGFNPLTGAVTYTPAAGYVGADAFAFAVTDDATAGGPALHSPPGVVYLQVVAAGGGEIVSAGGPDPGASGRGSGTVIGTGSGTGTGGGGSRSSTAAAAAIGPLVVAGAGAGGLPLVRAYDAATGAVRFSFLAYDPAYTGGVRVATGDVNDDGYPDIITATGPGGAANLKVFSGRDLALLASFYAYDPAFTGGFTVAAGNFDGLPGDEVVVGAGAGAAPHVRVFKIAGGAGVGLGSFYAFDPAFTGGVNVAAGDYDGRPGDEIVTGAASLGGPHVKVFTPSGATLASFFAFGNSLLGVSLAVGDVDGDGKADIITGPGDGGGPVVRVFAGGTGLMRGEFAAFDPDFRGGVWVGAADRDGDGKADILVARGQDARAVSSFDGETLALLGEFDAYDLDLPGGVFVAGG